MNHTSKAQTGGKLFTFLCLYIAQTIPMSFFSTVLPIIMRQEGYNLKTIGMLQLLKLPWILKFLWSPAIDRSSRSLTDYKRWILSSEFIYAAVILSISRLDLANNMPFIIALITLSFVASATQDIATDALAVVSFGKKDKSLVNSMQSVGSFAGTMVGGGLLLLLYNQIGWNLLLPYLALFVTLAIVPLLFYKKKWIEQPIEQKKLKPPHPDDLIGFFKQTGIWKQVIFLFLYYTGLIGTLSMLKPFLVDLGYSTSQIGVMSGIIGSTIGCLASLAGGFLVRRYGRYKMRIAFATNICITALYFCILVYYLPLNTATLHLAVALLWGSYGMATIVVYTTSMDCVRAGYEGTDFTLQTVITHLSGMIVAIAAGKFADSFGYEKLFIGEALIAVISLSYILITFRKPKNDDTRNYKKI